MNPLRSSIKYSNSAEPEPQEDTGLLSFLTPVSGNTGVIILTVPSNLSVSFIQLRFRHILQIKFWEFPLFELYLDLSIHHLDITKKSVLKMALDSGTAIKLDNIK